jgi:hypothetical protein
MKQWFVLSIGRTEILAMIPQFYFSPWIQSEGHVLTSALQDVSEDVTAALIFARKVDK